MLPEAAIALLGLSQASLTHAYQQGERKSTPKISSTPPLFSLIYLLHSPWVVVLPHVVIRI